MTLEITPLGARILVEPIEPIDEISARAAKSKLYVVTYDHNKPKPTEGIVVAVGTDPLVQEQIQVGDRVIFSRHSGSEIQVEGKTYRQLDLHEVISRIRSRATASESGEPPSSPS